MLPLFRSAPRWLLAGLLACAALACGDLESNEKFQTQVSRIDRINDELNNVHRDVGRLNTEYTTMDGQNQSILKDVSALKGTKLPGAAPAAGAPAADIKTLELRVKALEDQIKSLQSGAGALPVSKSNLSKRNPPPTAEPAAEPAPAPAPPADKGKSKTAPTRVAASGKTGSSRMTLVPKATAATSAGASKRGSRKNGITGTVQNDSGSSTAASPAPASGGASGSSASSSSPTSSGGGFYYHVAVNDTLAAIAERNHVTPAAILDANRLPNKFVLHQGQDLYIPRK